MSVIAASLFSQPFRGFGSCAWVMAWAPVFTRYYAVCVQVFTLPQVGVVWEEGNFVQMLSGSPYSR